MSNIPASVGVLTYNSEAHLARCLESVKDFADIIIADGGSTDGTLAMVERYDVRIIRQSAPGKPITDFALERNRLLEAARTPWFFYLDSDEIMTPELKEQIRNLSTGPKQPYQAYSVRYLKTSGNGMRIYRTFREYYQVRLARTDIGARFVRPVHERLELPEGTRVGRIEAPWYVPLDEEDLNARVFLRKAWKRTGVQADAWNPAGINDALRRIVALPAVLVVKSLVKMVAVKVRWGKNAIPFKYEMLRILYAFCIAAQSLRRVLRGRWAAS